VIGIVGDVRVQLHGDPRRSVTGSTLHHSRVDVLGHQGADGDVPQAVERQGWVEPGALDGRPERPLREPSAENATPRTDEREGEAVTDDLRPVLLEMTR
jgi:hypothetical protein